MGGLAYVMNCGLCAIVSCEEKQCPNEEVLCFSGDGAGDYTGPRYKQIYLPLGALCTLRGSESPLGEQILSGCQCLLHASVLVRSVRLGFDAKHGRSCECGRFEASIR